MTIQALFLRGIMTEDWVPDGIRNVPELVAIAIVLGIWAVVNGPMLFLRGPEDKISILLGTMGTLVWIGVIALLL